MDAELDLPGAPLPGGVDVSAYRVVQEALTNALQHADGRARCGSPRTASDLVIRCANPIGRARGTRGRARPARAWPSGWRCSAAGCATGPTPAAGFEVEAADPAGARDAVTRVVVADDQDLVRSGLQLVLEARGCEVVGTAGQRPRGGRRRAAGPAPTWC